MGSCSWLKEKYISLWDQAQLSWSFWIGFSRGAHSAIINASPMKRKDHLSSSTGLSHTQMRSSWSFRSKPWTMLERSQETWPECFMLWNEYSQTVISPPFWPSTRNWLSGSSGQNSNELLDDRFNFWGFNTQWGRSTASLTSSSTEWTWKVTTIKDRPTSLKMRKTSSQSTYPKEHSGT